MNSDRDNAGRFRPGAPSPNPTGRPKKTFGVDAAITRASADKITVTENGRRERKTKLETTATQIANKGASGDLRAAKMLIDQSRKAEERAAVEAVRAHIMAEADHEIAARVIVRLRQIIAEEDSHDASET